MRQNKISYYQKISFLNIFILVIALNFTLSITAAETTPKREFRSAWLATVYALDWPKTTNKASFVRNRPPFTKRKNN